MIKFIKKAIKSIKDLIRDYIFLYCKDCNKYTLHKFSIEYLEKLTSGLYMLVVRRYFCTRCGLNTSLCKKIN